jgi:hypothetical protein
MESFNFFFAIFLIDTHYAFKDGKVIAHKVTKKIDEETKKSLSAFGIKSIKAEQMYWRK